MITPLGKELRRLRLDRDWLLKGMADGIGVSSSFLSAIETGRKPIPDDFLERIVNWAQLDIDETARLRRAADQSALEVRIRMPRTASPSDREAMAVLARTFGELDSEKLAQFRALVLRGR